LANHIRTHEAWLGGAVQCRIFQAANRQRFDGLLASQHFGTTRQYVSGRQLLDTFSDDFSDKMEFKYRPPVEGRGLADET
jgi:hypothetical protein